MKIKLFLLAALIFPTLVTAASSTMTFQAGNIQNGETWPIDRSTGTASYYAEGRSGVVKFTCFLTSDTNNGCPNDKMYASLLTGKNFTNEHNVPYTLLKDGENGPYYWRLKDTGSNVGNIKVLYHCGENVTIQCQGTFEPDYAS